MSKKVFASMDGNQAAAHCAYAFTEVAGIYPITPSSPMPEYIDLWASQGKKNLFGMPVRVVEMESEAGAAGSVHGSLLSGALTTTFTASQGLLLKIPNMYKIGGELLPGVMHVAARTIAAHALSIFGDHSDVMATRQTGWAMLASGSVQEVMDLAGVAHLAAIESCVPFEHFFDGFRTSHEVNKIEVMDYAVFDKLLNREKVAEFRARALNSAFPTIHGTAQNDDVYFQAREASNKFYDAVPDIVAKYMKEISKVTGRKYAPFSYYGDPEAEEVIVLMGSGTQVSEEVVDYLRKKGKKVGVVEVHLYRPFSTKYLFKAVPKTVKRIAVLDRTKEPGADGEPLYLDVKSAYYGVKDAPLIVGGRYGLSSKDVSPRQIIAVFKNLEAKNPKDHFTVGIEDDVTKLSLPLGKEVAVGDPSTTELLFFGLGSDGTVGACKDAIKLIGDNTAMYAQAYSSYDSKKSGGVTRMHLRFGKNPIKSTYLVNTPDFVSCAQDSYLGKYDLINGIKPNGTFLLNTSYSDEELEEFMPNSVKKILAERKIRFFVIDASKLAKSVGLGGKINTVMESAFFKLNPQIIDYKKAVELMKYYVHKTFARKGDAIVEMNYRAVEIGGTGLRQVPVKAEWKNLGPDPVKEVGDRPDFVKNLADPVNAIRGYDLPVSAFKGYEDGLMPVGSTQYEKRSIAPAIPKWNPESCIQCNQCAFVCPHAAIRPFLVTPEEEAKAPAGAEYLKAMGKGFENYKFRIQISVEDCTGCGVCITQCPGMKGVKALTVTPIHVALESPEVELGHYFYNEVSDKHVAKNNPKNLQFTKPLFEFSGACAGCGETPYVKNVTQLFGERMVVANATGCSSIYGASFPASPYTVNEEGRGPAWANSLFEDNAEFGFGMRVAVEALRDRLQNTMANNLKKMNAEQKALVEEWIANRDNGDKTKELAPKIVAAFENDNAAYAKEIIEFKDYLIKISQWIIGGDGWAYDIGYGGLDHVIANNEDVNILVVDTEVYSNTGGQSSKSSRTGSIAKFTASGKRAKKKDLASIAMSYGHVYVATVSHGANQNQVIKALKEAEAYKGPSIVICYAPCIAHNIKSGLYMSQNEAKLATECGYFPTFRFNPDLAKEGKNPFTMDSKEPNWDKYRAFLMNEGRYAQLVKVNPEKAEALLEFNKTDAQNRYKHYLELANNPEYNK
ncbi:MAG: pyruvate:ferredoxin (flavodoxin) oxidoreductase [Gammaproteobacteria bacterium]|nr:pyruvate:ferredoxin (flavodoxin) oxidoreductase [Gammaproteobacteria bacterium]